MEISFVPGFIVHRLASDDHARIHINAILSTAVLFFVSVLFVRFPGILHSMPHICIVETLLGIPCPGCGTISACIATLSGDFSVAWAANPAGMLLIGYLAIRIPLCMFGLVCPRSSEMVFRVSRYGGNVMLAALIAVWINRIVIQFWIN